MPEFGLVRNSTIAPIHLGNHEVPAQSIGRLPLPMVTELLAHPVPGLVPVDDHPTLRPFKQTAHQPWGIRYQECSGDER